MIEVKVRWFAAFRELTGISAEIVETGATTPGELFDELRREHNGLGERGAALVAVNDELSTWDAILSNGDEVLFFPPVAGG